ncbi:hypothetical protein BDW22DRAFT_1363773 [Trametopsis cervina]|nr:hypothetical protein BDW22DRAFT_1363773 [Trametopsis cervina]
MACRDFPPSSDHVAAFLAESNPLQLRPSLARFLKVQNLNWPLYSPDSSSIRHLL